MKRIMIILCLFAAATGYCQDNWILKNPVNKPLMRDGHAMASIAGGKVLLFGGTPGSINDETWLYDLTNNTWTFMNPSTKPSPRAGHTMASVGGDKVMLFGGTDAAGFDGETWTYDLSDNKWTLMNPVKKPSPRVFHAMANIGTDKVLLFGGSDAGGFDGETWLYDLSDNNWTEKITSVKPSARAQHAMAFIRGSFSEHVMLFGGKGTGGLNNETWVYNVNGNTWTQRTPALKPLKRSFHAMATYSGDQVLLFGGTTTGTGSGKSNETWLYDFTDDKWTSKNPITKPSSRYMHAVSSTGGTPVILFGGLDANGINDETWVYGELTAPVITCPANITISTSLNSCSQGVPFNVTATGNPAPTVVAMLDDHQIFSHHTFPLGTRTVNCFATNGIGDTAFCSFTVTVEDRISPKLTCPADMIVNPTTLDGAVVNYTVPIATDNCSATLTQTAGLASGSLFPIGTTINEFKATDAAGNSTACSFKITVTDPHCDPNKVSMCESGTTICVDEEDVPKLLERGATLGKCPEGKLSSTAIPTKPAIIPGGYTLETYPNPFHAATKIQYTIANDAQISLAVFNRLGQKLIQLVNSHVVSGNHTVDFDASSLMPGIYYCKMQVLSADKKTFEVIKKMVLIK